jgi:mannose-6-phosphate isomerase-like protein (cupin superfamily)
MLYAIANGLGVEVTHFFPDVAPVAQVVRADQRKALRFEGSYLTYSPLSSRSPNRKLQSLVVRIDPQDGALPADEFRSHPGEEFYYVLDGSVRFWVGDAVHDLGPGDSMHIKSTVKHRLVNPGGEPATCFCVLTPTIL